MPIADRERLRQVFKTMQAWHGFGLLMGGSVRIDSSKIELMSDRCLIKNRTENLMRRRGIKEEVEYGIAARVVETHRRGLRIGPQKDQEPPRCSRTSVKCCEARLLASSVGLNLVRADLELVRDKAGGRSRSYAQIARNEAEVAKCTKLKREPQAVCCPPPDGDEVSVGTRQRECSDQVIARDFFGKAGQPSQLSL